MSLLPYASLTHRRKALRPTGDVVLLSSQTASGDSTISFTSKITSTYGEYIFGIYNYNPATDNSHLEFQVSIDGGSNYNVSLTCTYWHAYHNESDSAATLTYATSNDQVGTSFQMLMEDVGGQADESGSGELHLFNPASTTFAKHWYSEFINYYGNGDFAMHSFPAGYFNTTSAINAVQFKAESGVFDGKFKLWGVK